MKDIPDASVDMILCDLPYGTTNCKWDCIIPFGPLWEIYKRIIKPNGAIVLFGAQPFTSALIMSNPIMFKYDWIWRKDKATGHLNTKKMPLRNKEDILVFYMKQCCYNPQFSVGTPYKNKAGKDHSLKTSMTDSYNEYSNFRYDNDGKRYPKQILDFGVVQRNTLHPTEKPVPLLEYLIKTYTNEGDLVLDNCMGSGSTGEAALKTGRRFIGMEKDEKYFKVASDRLSALLG